MPQEIAGEKAEVDRVYEAVNVLLYLQVNILFKFLRELLSVTLIT